jgi:hypothetical protein
MFFLLLRLLTVPAPMAAPVAATATAVRPPAAIDVATLRDAGADMATIEAGPRKIRALLPAAGDRAVYAGCVAQRLVEAQAQIAIARDEMQRLSADPPPPAADRAHARNRIALLAQRTRDVERAALHCVDEDDSTISATRKETQVPPAIQRRPDPTRPPPMPYPAPVGGASVVIPEP